MSAPIPLVDLAAQQQEIRECLRPDLDELMRTAAFIGGPHVREFERLYAGYVGVRHCVGVANGTDAVELALRAVGVGPGDEVIIPANTFIATAEAVVRAGGVPVPVDVDSQSLLMDPKRAGDAVTKRTRAVVPVHLFGRMAPVEEIRSSVAATGRIAIVEDAAQSHGASIAGRRSGAAGLIAATSFYPGKNLGAAGDAGAVTTDDDVLAERVRLLGNHGSPRKYTHEVVGFNSRLDAVQALVLQHKLARLESWNALRREAATRYDKLLADLASVGRPAIPAAQEHAWHLYVIRVPDRDRVLGVLHAHDIGAGVHYPDPIHRTLAFRGLRAPKGGLTVSERASQEILSLPMYPHITQEQQERVVSVLKNALRP